MRVRPMRLPGVFASGSISVAARAGKLWMGEKHVFSGDQGDSRGAHGCSLRRILKHDET